MNIFKYDTKTISISQLPDVVGQLKKVVGDLIAIPIDCELLIDAPLSQLLDVKEKIDKAITEKLAKDKDNEKYNIIKDKEEEFYEFCNSHKCSDCPCSGSQTMLQCLYKWSKLECREAGELKEN